MADAFAVREPYRTVLEVGATLSASLDLEEVFQTIARQVGEALGVMSCDINEYDAAARTMTYVAVWSEQLTQADLDYVGTVIDLDERPGRDAVIRRGDLLESYIDDEGLDPIEHQMMLDYDEKAMMEMPLVFAGETIGVLGVTDSCRDRRFTEDEKRLLRLLARPAAAAIGNARLYRGRRELARRMATLLDSSRALAASVDLDEVLTRVARLAADAVGVSYATVYEYRRRHDAIVFTADSGPGGRKTRPLESFRGAVYRLSELPGERAILEGTSVVQEHVSDEGLAADRRRSMLDWSQRTCLTLPLRFAGRPQGLLRLTCTEAERRFTDQEVELLEGLGESASAAIHNARLFHEQSRQSARLLDLFEVSRRFTSTFDLEAVVTAVEEGAGQLLGEGARARVWLRDEDGSPAPATQRSAGDPSSWRPGLVHEALGSGHLAERVSDEGSGLALPLTVKDRTEGAMVVETDGYRRFASAEREALQVMANQAAAALTNVRLYRRTERQAIRDGLTGLYNHRHFRERLLQECSRAHRYGIPLSLLMLDLDDFKSFNDRFGHQLGDEVLREIGEILLAGTRRGVDLAARYGGEEFAVILPHTPVRGAGASSPGGGSASLADGEASAPSPDADVLPPAGTGALVVAERLRAAIADRAFPGCGGRRYTHITATIGVAELDRACSGPADLVENADAALYVGKRAGRDQVAVHAG